MAEYSFTGDPNVDAMILQNLQAGFGQIYNRNKNQLNQSLTERGFGSGGGIYDEQLAGLIGERAGLEGQAQLSMAHAAADRYNQQKQREQDVLNQMRLYEYQAKLNRPRKASKGQAALTGAATGASLGSLGGPWGALFGGAAGGIHGLIDPSAFGG